MGIQDPGLPCLACPGPISSAGVDPGQFLLTPHTLPGPTAEQNIWDDFFYLTRFGGSQSPSHTICSLISSSRKIRNLLRGLSKLGLVVNP